MANFAHLLKLPGPAQYQAWVKERLETLSVREGYALAAVLMRSSPRDAEEAVDCLNSLDHYDVCPAGSYEELGQFYLQQLNTPEDVLPHADLDGLGRFFEDQHPGLFIGHYYVSYPKQPSLPIRQENGAPLLWDDSWSVKLKLASPAVPDGVWLRLPDYEPVNEFGLGEINMVRRELRVDSLDECTLLEARCILPEVRDLVKQYSSIEELVGDGDSLGYVLAEKGQGEPHWLEKFAAALEYEDCRTLDFAANHLRDEGMPEELIQSGAIDLDSYANDLLETSGYMEASGETGYLIRNGREFIRDYTSPAQQALSQPEQGIAMQ